MLGALGNIEKNQKTLIFFSHDGGCWENVRG
jgi:hypothetical protein